MAITAETVAEALEEPAFQRDERFLTALLRLASG
jgi:hypothetical protein